MQIGLSYDILLVPIKRKCQTYWNAGTNTKDVLL